MLVGIDRKWTPLADRNFGAFYGVSDMVARIEYEFPYLLPDLRIAPRIIIASDYSGDHQTKQGARYRALSFLVADQGRLRTWRKAVDALRAEKIRDTREISYKKRNEPVRAAIMPLWLGMANLIPGLCVTVLIDRNLDDVALGPSREHLLSGGMNPELVEKWTPESFERMMRVLFYGLTFAAGLARKPQPVIWVTDDDQIVTEAVKDDFGTFMVATANTLFSYEPHIRFTRVSDGDRGRQSRKDLCSIPDLAAGTMCDVNAAYKDEGIARPKGVVVAPPRSLRPDVAPLAQWHADNRWPLKKLVFMVQPGRAADDPPQTIHYLQHAILPPRLVDAPIPKGIGSIAASHPVAEFGRVMVPLEDGRPIIIGHEPNRWLVYDRRGSLLTDSSDRIDALDRAQYVLGLRQIAGVV